MDPFYKSRLPANIAGLVDRIEDFAKREIGVAVDDRPVSLTSPNPDRLASNVTHESAKILLRSRDVFDPHSVLHELLHIERLWVERIPQLLAKYDYQLASITGALENALEHLIIVPREADYGFDPYPYWNDTVRRNWDKYPWPDMKDRSVRRINCLLGWLSASNLVNDPAVREHVEECLKGEGLFDEAERFRARIAEKLSSKVQAISTVVRFLKSPRDEVHVVRIDVVNSRPEFIPLPLN